jgi:DNA-binding PucR family transcriptional regulator
MLLPHKDEWMKKYINDIIQPIINYDEGKLIETAREFIANYGDIIKTAEKMYQHKNTIRYRIQKMKALLDIESDSEFYEQLSIAIKCEKIL